QAALLEEPGRSVRTQGPRSISARHNFWPNFPNVSGERQGHDEVCAGSSPDPGLPVVPRRSRGRKDPFGYAKEGMKVGDLRGAFVVPASTEELVKTASSNSLVIFTTSLLSLLTAAAVVLVLVRKLIIRPLSASVHL